MDLQRGKLILCIIVMSAFSQFVHSIVGVRINPDVSELTIASGSTLMLNCIADEPTQWYYPKGSSNITKKMEIETVGGTYYNNLTINPIDYLDTGYFICQSETNASYSAQIYIYCSDEKHPLAIVPDMIETAVYDTAIIPCKPTSPNISVSLTRNRVKMEPIEKYDPKIGYIISTYPFTDFVFLNCIPLEVGVSRGLGLKVHLPRNGSSKPHIEVFDSNLKYPIFENQNITLNCSIITSLDMSIKNLNWTFPRAETKMTIGNLTEVKHDKWYNQHFILFFQSVTIYNVTKDDQGNYTCTVIDDFSNTKVSTYSLRIESLNSIFLNISEKLNTVTVKARENCTAEFIAFIEAFPHRTTRTWYDPQGKKINDADSNDNYDIIDKEFEIKLKIKNVEMENFGTYQLAVDNSWITKTLTFHLIVEDSPRIINWKKQSSALLNENVTYTFECINTGYPLPQISWSFHDCIDIPACENNTSLYPPIVRQKEEIVQPYKVRSTVQFKPNETMLVRCEANNSMGSSVASSLLLLSDYSSGITILEKYTKPITVGDNVKLVCMVSKNRYTNNFTWIFRNTEITPSSEIQIENSATKLSYVSTLSITNMQKNQSGDYICRNSLQDPSYKNRYSLGEINRRPLMIQDIVYPSIRKSNMNKGVLHVVPGTSVNMVIQFGGAPPPTTIWYKNDKPLSFNDRIISKKLVWGNRNLIIANVSRDDEGMYSCVATNKAGSVSDNLQLIIQNLDSGKYIYYNYIIFGFSFSVVILLAGILLWYIRKLKEKKKRLQKMLQECGLKINENNEAPNLNPDVDIIDQAYLIPYEKKWEYPKEKLKFGEILGCGEFGIVRKAKALDIIETGIQTTVAVKQAKWQADSFPIKALLSELKVMIYLGQHSNVVRLLGACTKNIIKGELFVIVEYCKYGNFRNFLLKQRNNFIDQIDKNDEIDFSKTTTVRSESTSNGIELESTKNFSEEISSRKLSHSESGPYYSTVSKSVDYDDILRNPIKTVDLISWSLQVARGMEYLASRKVLHGDLAARNILLTETNTVKICDFGFAKNIYHQKEDYISSKPKFPIKWMAIESIAFKIFSTPTDVWSYGVTIWEFFSLGVLPYPGLEVTSLYEELLSGYRMGKPKFATFKIYDLMKDCWDKDPKLRPSFTEICEKLTGLLQDSVPSQYVKLNEMSSGEIDADVCDKENYLKIWNSSQSRNSNGNQIQQNISANVPSKMVHNQSYFEMIEMSEDSNRL